MDKRSKIRLSVGGTTVFKLFLLTGIVFISIVFVWYTLDVIGQLKKDAERMASSYVKLWQLAASENSTGGEVQVIFEEIIKKASFPVVIAGMDGEPIFWRNVSGIVDNDPSPETLEKVKKLIVEMREDKGEFPLLFDGMIISYFYYGDSRVIRQLQWMPFVEIGLMTAFIMIGFIGFQNIRRSEVRHIWVGMAKEAAHQLGTPISSLMGWLEILSSRPGERNTRDDHSSPPDSEIYTQMQTDVYRLQRVANRFGQIGSIPEVEETDIARLIEETVSYFKKRLPFNGQGVDIVFHCENLPSVLINRELFTWAIENLIKNSLQAVNPQSGKIKLVVSSTLEPENIIIDIIDNGVGVPHGIARKLFRPGFTTKKRGWGLGLTLVRRIIEEYHRGWITLLRSRPGETVFRITLSVKGSKRTFHWYNIWSKRKT